MNGPPAAGGQSWAVWPCHWNPPQETVRPSSAWIRGCLTLQAILYGSWPMPTTAPRSSPIRVSDPRLPTTAGGQLVLAAEVSPAAFVERLGSHLITLESLPGDLADAGLVYRLALWIKYGPAAVERFALAPAPAQTPGDELAHGLGSAAAVPGPSGPRPRPHRHRHAPAPANTPTPSPTTTPTEIATTTETATATASPTATSTPVPQRCSAQVGTASTCAAAPGRPTCPRLPRYQAAMPSCRWT